MSIPKKYKAEIISFNNPIDNIYTVEFKSLSGKFKYKPGQFLHLAIDEYDPSFGWPESRCFSIQSSCSSALLKITFSVKGSFTSRMVKELEIGKNINLKLPFGQLFQEDFSITNSVFIAGGTGITPFLSLFGESCFSTFLNPVLYLGVRSKAYNLYDEELSIAKGINPTFKSYARFEDVDGKLDIDEIFKENGFNKTYFISGPQLMISKFKSTLIKYGVQSERIRTDDWE